MSLTYADARSKSLPRTAAIIVVVALHVAMFYALSTGMGSITLLKPIKDTVAVFIPLEKPPTPQPKIAPPKVTQQAAPTELTPTPVETPILPDLPPVAESDGGITTDAAPTNEGASAPPNSFTIKHRVDPPYPSASRRAGEQGTVLLTIVIGQDGRPLDISVARSSGYAALDESAVNAVRQWRFSTNVNASQARVSLPITFRLNGR
jgi:protein TonB